MLFKKTFFLLLLCLPILALASPALLQCDSNFPTSLCILLNNLTGFTIDSTIHKNISTIIVTSSEYIYVTLWSIELSWKSVKSYLEGDYGKLWSFVLIRLITAAFFLYWIHHPDIWSSIISYFISIGNNINNIIANSNIYTNGSGTVNFGLNGFITPVKLIQLIYDMNNLGFTLLSTFSILSPSALMDLIIILIMDFSLLLLAIIIFMTLLEAYFATTGGLILIGFAGSSWSFQYFNSFLRYIINLSLRFMIVCILLGIFKNTLLGMVQDLNSAMSTGDPIDPIATNRTLFGGMLSICVMTILTGILPYMARSMIGGVISNGIDGLLRANIGGASTGINNVMNSALNRNNFNNNNEGASVANNFSNSKNHNQSNVNGNQVINPSNVAKEANGFIKSIDSQIQSNKPKKEFLDGGK